MRKRLMVLILVLGVLFAPAVAFADDFGGSDGGDFSDRVIYGPNVLNIQSGTYGVQVYSGNKFNAALCVLGFDGNDSRFTNDVKAYLSNESTGGSFYEFSNLFTNNNSPNISGLDAYNITFTSAIGTNNTIYGAEFVWIAQYTDVLRQAAYARVEEVLNGNVGGGNIETDENYIYFTGNLHYTNWSGNAYPYLIGSDGKYYSLRYDMQLVDGQWQYSEFDGSSASKTKLLPEPLTIRINKNNFGTLPDSLDNLVLYANFGTDTLQLIVLNTDSTTTGTNNNQFSSSQYISRVHTTQLCDLGTVTRNGSRTFTFEGNLISVENVSSYAASFRNNSTNYSQSTSIMLLPYGSGGASTPVVPPTQWPEPDPVTPTEPPVVPDPPSSDPVSDPTNVNIGIPQLPDIGLSIAPTYGTADLSAVLDAMAKHCQHLQTCMIDSFDGYYSSITQFEKSLQENTKEFQRSWFRVILDTIRDCFDDLSDYLQTLFTWLANQMDFTFTGGDFDDSSIVWWLKRIYSKLGSGTTVKPTDPVVDPTGIGDWFDQLLKNFVLDLLALGQDALADVAEMFRQLITKFPFSIPWDIAAMLALFAASPQIPVIEIPQYALTGNGISQVGMYTIDLTPYDGAMGIARSVENVVFAFWLAWKIDFFKAILTGVLGGDK